MSNNICKDDLCESKFVYSIEDKCCVAKIELNIEINQRVLTYTVTNIGTMNLCNDIILCSKLFGKTRISNKFLDYKDSVSVTKNMNDIKFPMVIEYEKAAAFTCFGEKLYLASHEFCVSFQNGDAPIPPDPSGFAILDHDIRIVNDSPNQVNLTIYNSPFSTLALENVEFLIPYSMYFDSSSLDSFDSSENVTSIDSTPGGILVKANLIPVREGISIMLRFNSILNVHIPFSFKINTDTPVIEYTNFFSKLVYIPGP